VEWLRPGVVEQGARAVPFIGGRGGGEEGGNGERQRARHDGGDGANGDGMARAGEGCGDGSGTVAGR
jgi:hypothetical protein